MKNNYKIPWHIRQYVKKELMDYKKNRKLLDKLISDYSEYTINTRSIALIKLRVMQIEKVLSKLNKEDKEAAEIIFFYHYTQSGAEVAKGLSKGAYYNAMNKVIYLTAQEMELI